MKKIVFRTNGGKNIGLGHIFRCLSLAKAIKRVKPLIDIAFIVNEEIVSIVEREKFDVIKSNHFDDISLMKRYKPDIVILDSYLANNEYLHDLKNLAKLVIFDDNNDIYDSNIPDIIINGNLHAEDLKYSDKPIKLLGPKYLAIKEEYWEVNSQKINEDKSEIMITTGGSDFNKLMIKFIKSLKSLPMKKNIIIGPLYEENYIKQIKSKVNYTFNLIYGPSSLKQYIERSSIVITAAGSTIYEVLTLKKIPIIYTLAKNQNLIAKKIEQYGIINLGNYGQIDFNSIEQKASILLKNKEEYHNNFLKLYSLFDGKGALRIAEKILRKV